MALDHAAEILLTHDRWATANLIQACGSLTHEQFHRPFKMGPGSLHNTIRHILGAKRGWADMLAGRMLPPQTPRPRLEDEGAFSPEELARLHESISDEFDALARAGDPGDAIVGERGGRRYTFTRACIVAHVCTHAMHHRAQCLNMLRTLAVDPLPPSSVMEWSLMNAES